MLIVIKTNEVNNMKPCIYLALTLFSLSVSNVQATDKRSIEEIATLKKFMNVAAGLTGGALAGMATSTGGTKEPLTLLVASIIGYTFGSTVTNQMSDFAHLDKDNSTSISFWTLFLGTTLFDYVRNTGIIVA